MFFIMLDTVRNHGLVSQSLVVEQGDAGQPVAVAFVARTLDVVLLAGEIPHEIAPVHESHLVGHEPTDIISKCWNFYC